MRDCLANALTYDARVCASVHDQPFALQLRSELMQVACGVAGCGLLELQVQQLFLRREEGGMKIHDPVDSGIRARAASVVERGLALREKLQQLYPAALAVLRREAEGITDAEESMVRLGTQGECIGPIWHPTEAGRYPP